MLKDTFTTLAGSCTTDLVLTEKLWLFIEKKYTAKGRHYHNLRHLEHLLAQMESCKALVTDWDCTLFALFYHDIIYKATAKDNEERSADKADLDLTAIAFPADRIEKCKTIILATKSHAISLHNDTNLFTDADLSILGSDWETYNDYFKNVRKEYSVYPDFMYNPGRKKVLKHFLEMEHIFKTDFFRHKFEVMARENISKEMEML